MHNLNLWDYLGMRELIVKILGITIRQSEIIKNVVVTWERIFSELYAMHDRLAINKF